MERAAVELSVVGDDDFRKRRIPAKDHMTAPLSHNVEACTLKRPDAVPA